MTEIHRPYRSTHRMVILSALLLGALTVLGMAVMPQQSAHAAATANGAAETEAPTKPKAKVVTCVADPRVDNLFEHCKRSISLGDIVKVTRWLPYEDGTTWKYCKYEFKVDSIGTLPPSATGVVMVAYGEACKDFKIFVGTRDGVFHYKVIKGKGKSNK